MKGLEQRRHDAAEKADDFKVKFDKLCGMVHYLLFLYVSVFICSYVDLIVEMSVA